VRFISNRSSGQMGYALAQTAQELGADVTLITGPTALPEPSGVTTIRVRSAVQMLAEVQRTFVGQDWMIATAAVADYRVAQPAEHKLKKQGDNAPLTLTLVQNPDIVAWAASQDNRGRVVAFAAETENLLANAQAKLVKKGVDAVLANWVNDGKGFEQTENQLFLLSAQGVSDLGSAPKAELAWVVWQALCACFDH
jgi:phosphopantothenoylcysteine decarboxylase/phosphopantothenate--cysteine ligase